VRRDLLQLKLKKGSDGEGEVYGEGPKILANFWLLQVCPWVRRLGRLRLRDGFPAVAASKKPEQSVQAGANDKQPLD